MKLKFVKAAAALTIAASAILAPVAANAAVTPYPPTPTAAVTNNIVTVVFGPGSFAGAENVTIIIVGENASQATLAAVAPNGPKTVGTVLSAADGSAVARIALPAGAEGRYTVTGVSDSRPEGVSVSFTVAAAGGGNGGGSLPVTGMDSGSLLGLWVGGGALVLAGGAVAVGAAVHRQRKQAA